MDRPALHAMVAVRGGVALAAGATTAAVAVPLVDVPAALVAGWTVTALVAAAWTLLVVWRMDAARTRSHATAEDPGSRTSRIVAVLGGLGSIGAVAVMLTETSHGGGLGFARAGIAVLCVGSSWLLIQTVSCLRIADVYYREPVGGLSFHQDEDPTYADFAYVAFGVGMTYQVADTDVTDSGMRRILLGQALLGYLFGAVILGAVINLIANL